MNLNYLKIKSQVNELMSSQTSFQMVRNIKANDPSLKSWLEISKDSDFPIQNLPFGIYSTKNKTKRVGVAIGDQILDLFNLYELGYLDSLSFCEHCFSNEYLNRMMGHGKLEIRDLRNRISELLNVENPELFKIKKPFQKY